MKTIKASAKNYRKLIKKGFKPLHEMHFIPHNVNKFVIFKDNYFSCLN